jgi:hypothetical protein
VIVCRRIARSTERPKAPRSPSRWIGGGCALPVGNITLGSLIASRFFSLTTSVRVSIEKWVDDGIGRLVGMLQSRRSGEERVNLSDQDLESSDKVRKLGRAPVALRILGGAALAWGAFLGLGMITAIVGTQSTYGDVDTVGTLTDWTATVALVVVGRGLLRSRWWAGVGAWATSVGLTVFGVYWVIWGNSDTGPGAPIPHPVTGAALPWPVFVVPGLVIAATLLPRSSRAWIRRARREHKASRPLGHGN